MIIKKLRSIGNSYGVIIPKAILEGLSIRPALDEVVLELENDCIKIRKLKKSDRDE